MTAREVYGQIYKGAGAYTTDAGPWISAGDYYALEMAHDQLKEKFNATDAAATALGNHVQLLERLFSARGDTLISMREEYLHLARVLRSARDLLQGEFYAEALGELDDACSHADAVNSQSTSKTEQP